MMKMKKLNISKKRKEDNMKIVLAVAILIVLYFVFR